MSSPDLRVLRYGVVPYGQGLALQLALRDRLQSEAGGPDGYVVCLEHEPVVTLGKRGRESDLVSRDLLRERGVEVFRVDRGGEATYHGPGQLVIYPIVRLDALGLGVVDLVRGLAGCLSDVLLTYGVTASYDPEHPGLWTDENPSRKIASVGMRVKGGVTTHGAAINLVNDMIPFSYIVACGMPNAPMTRLQDYLDDALSLPEFRDRLLARFSDFLACTFEPANEPLPERDQWVESLTY